jgi:FtsP/CotA-like multicopper oxidase with cupredoxin domain
MNYFDYEVRPDLDDAGTYFYHSHVGFQAISASGPLIVKTATRHRIRTMTISFSSATPTT